MTMAISIIAIIISLFSAGVCLTVVLEKRRATRELDAIIKDIQSQPVPKNPVAKVDGIGIMSYDKVRNTIVVNGNIEAEGWIAAGKVEE